LYRIVVTNVGYGDGHGLAVVDTCPPVVGGWILPAVGWPGRWVTDAGRGRSTMDGDRPVDVTLGTVYTFTIAASRGVCVPDAGGGDGVRGAGSGVHDDGNVHERVRFMVAHRC